MTDVVTNGILIFSRAGMKFVSSYEAMVKCLMEPKYAKELTFPEMEKILAADCLRYNTDLSFVLNEQLKPYFHSIGLEI